MPRAMPPLPPGPELVQDLGQVHVRVLAMALFRPLLDADRPGFGGGKVPDAVLHAIALAAKERGNGGTLVERNQYIYKCSYVWTL